MNKPKTVVIQNDNLCAEIDLMHGATCVKLYDKVNGINVLHSSDNHYLNGMPILFPANRISNGCFNCCGHTYNLPVTDEKHHCSLHGEMLDLPFELQSQSPNEVLCRREFLKDYPGFLQHFCVYLNYKLCENALIQTLRVVNYSDIPLPLMFGFHTTFCVPFCQHSKAENIKIYADVDQEFQRGADLLPIAVHPVTDEFGKALQKGVCEIPKTVSRHYQAGGKGDMAMVDLHSGVKVHYEPDPAFKFRMIYTSDGEDFICLEPQICVTNAPNAPLDKQYTRIPTLSQGKIKEYKSKISLYASPKKEIIP